MKPQLVCFDVDGTLVDTLPRAYATDCRIIAELGGQIPTMQAYRNNRYRGNWKEFYKNFGVKNHEEALRRFYEYIHIDDLAAICGASETLDKIMSAGLNIAIVSLTSSRERLLLKLKNTGLLQHFDLKSIYVSDSIKGKAPLISQECSRIGAGRERTVFIGDTTYDIHEGKKAGARTVGLSSLNSFEDELSIVEASPDYIINRLIDLPNLLEEI